MENVLGYILAKGPDGLQAVLTEVLEKTKVDPVFKTQAHYILYELGNQKSLIKMDFTEWPVVFWHCDLLGRPATSAVKDVIARFAWDKCGEKEWFFKEKGGEEVYFKEEGADEDRAFSEWREKIFEGKVSAD